MPDRATPGCSQRKKTPPSKRRGRSLRSKARRSLRRLGRSTCRRSCRVGVPGPLWSSIHLHRRGTAREGRREAGHRLYWQGLQHWSNSDDYTPTALGHLCVKCKCKEPRLMLTKCRSINSLLFGLHKYKTRLRCTQM